MGRRALAVLAAGSECGGVGKDVGVIEGELLAAPVRDPFRRRGVVSGRRLGAVDAREIGNRAGVAAGVALGIGVDADQLEVAYIDAGFFLELAAAGGLHRL